MKSAKGAAHPSVKPVNTYLECFGQAHDLASTESTTAHSPESHADIASLLDAALCTAEAAWDGAAFVNPSAVDESADGLEDVR